MSTTLPHRYWVCRQLGLVHSLGFTVRSLVVVSQKSGEGHQGFVTATGVHGVTEAQDDPAFKAILNASDLYGPEGVPMVWLSRRAGHAHVDRVFGPDIMLKATEALTDQMSSRTGADRVRLLRRRNAYGN